MAAYKVCKSNDFANNSANGYSVIHEGDDFGKATDEAVSHYGVCVRVSDGAIFGEDGWGGKFDPRPCRVVNVEEKSYA